MDGLHLARLSLGVTCFLLLDLFAAPRSGLAAKHHIDVGGKGGRKFRRAAIQSTLNYCLLILCTVVQPVSLMPTTEAAWA